jgi:serine protease AprX
MAGQRAPLTLLCALLATSLGVPGVAMAADSPPPVVGAAEAPRSADGGAVPPRDSGWGDDTTYEGARSTRIAGTWVPQHDHGSMWQVTKSTGAQDVWGESAPNGSGRKLTGHGVGVALIDTGIAPVEGLATTGKIVNGPDLSFESQASNTRYLDGYGHGTHLAGIIAGKDSTVQKGKEDEGQFVGMAPDATLVNVKVGVADGAADVSQVIAAIDWVVANRTTHNIRVLNLSYGTSSSQAPTLDPLAHAVQNAWRAGIVVVVAAGNDGERGATTLRMPAVDPYVIAVGSSDNNGSDNREDLSVGAWTNDGTSTRRPDLLAPGKSVVSLRVPGSLVDKEHPEGLVVGDSTGRMFRGTGTSQSAAVVSGAAALLLQRNPTLTPDRVKGLLRASADKLPASTDPTQGAGALDIRGAVDLLERGSRTSYQQSWPASTGLGSLEAARGGSHVADPDNGAILSGEMDIFGVAWDAATWASASAQWQAWNGGAWRGSDWAGAGWSGSSWAAVNWSRRSWSDVDWSRRSWSTMSFLRRSWSGDDWARRSWSADNFSRRSWSTGDWVLSGNW